MDLIKRDFYFRYLGSILGRFWNFASPLAMILIYTFVFGIVMKARLGEGAGSDDRFAYVLFLCSGLFAWTAFQDMVGRGGTMFIENSHLIKKVAFPMEILPMIVVGSATINYLISMGMFVVLMVAVGHAPDMLVLAVPFIYALQVLFCVGLMLTFGVLNVFLRDTQQLVHILFMVWFWVTPIVYDISRVPGVFKTIIMLNPMFYFINLYQKVIFFRTVPTTFEIVVPIMCTLTALIVGSTLLARLKAEIPDEI